MLDCSYLAEDGEGCCGHNPAPPWQYSPGAFRQMNLIIYMSYYVEWSRYQLIV